jgi:hypothetical protein
MVELAQLHHIKIILCTLTPISDATVLPAPDSFTESRRKQSEKRPPSDILKLNAWVNDYVTNINVLTWITTPLRSTRRLKSRAGIPTTACTSTHVASSIPAAAPEIADGNELEVEFLVVLREGRNQGAFPTSGSANNRYSDAIVGGPVRK